MIFDHQSRGSKGVRAISDQFRLLIYSHDTFGLGHLRRCRAIAHAIAAHRQDISCLILSGSPIIGSYGFRPRVDFVRFPGVVKLRNGSYSPRGLDISIEDAISIREKLIRSSAEAFRPHIFLVDKEPLGLRGEVGPTLTMLKESGTRLVLGLRDIMDDQDQLAEEWDRKAVMPALMDLYDDIWVYGSNSIYDPLAGLKVPPAVRRKMSYMGYLRRNVGYEGEFERASTAAMPDKFILVTTGGGGDGASLVDWVISACEHTELPHNLLIVLGPFMPAKQQAAFKARTSRLPNVTLATFVPDLDRVMSKATAVIAMGGYNTFCEILAADKPALIVPRTVPRLEQFIRADRMSKLGLVSMLVDDDHRSITAMAEAIRRLPDQPAPSTVKLAGYVDGFDAINMVIDGWLGPCNAESRPLELISG
jgi:predicted glycosyltransferase